MKLPLVPLVAFFSFYPQVSTAEISGSLATPQTNFVYMCDSSIYEGMSCQSITNTTLINVSAQNLPYLVNPECEMNPNDIGCDSPPEVGFAYHTHIILNAKTGIATRKQVFVNGGIGGSVNYSVTNLSPTTQDNEMAQSLKIAEYTKDVVSKRYNFEISESGEVVNKLGETIDDVYYLTGGAASQSSGDGLPSDNIPNCGTMLDYVNNSRYDSTLPRCAAFINTFLTNSWDQINTSKITTELRKLDVQFQLLGVTISKKAENQFKLQFKYSDQSILVITIHINDENIVNGLEVDDLASRTAEGLTLRQHRSHLLSNIVPADFSTAESMAIGLLTGDYGCVSTLRTVGYHQRFQVTIIERGPDGTPKQVEFKLLSQTPEFQEVIVCGGGLRP